MLLNVLNDHDVLNCHLHGGASSAHPLTPHRHTFHTVPNATPPISVLDTDLLALDYLWHVYACAPGPEQQPLLAHLYNCAAMGDGRRDAVLQALAECVGVHLYSVCVRVCVLQANMVPTVVK